MAKGLLDRIFISPDHLPDRVQNLITDVAILKCFFSSVFHKPVVEKGPRLSFGVLYVFNQGLLQRLAAAHSNWRRGVDWVSWKKRRLTWNSDLLKDEDEE